MSNADRFGCVTHEHILNSGFKVDRVRDYVDYTLYDYSKDGKLFLTGGYWNYMISNINGVILFDGWWNSNDEFSKTISEIESNT